jgi:hypothetical protein
MNSTAHIRNNETMEVRTLPTTIDEFAWSEGNFSCDCNREARFKRAAGEAVDCNSLKCSDGRYSVNLSRDGETYYKEFE